MGYNPFSSSLENISGQDLLILKDVTEGWYVDYKRQSIEVKEYSKHLSSFANQFGGWLFIGVSEDSKTQTASEFPGIPKNEVSNTLVKIREAVSAHMQPEAYFQTKTINGPIPEIDLHADKAIIIVRIPQGDNPPYVHSSGRIFRRISDQSKPVQAESNRYAIDELLNRSKEGTKRRLEFISNPVDIYKKEILTPAVCFYLFTDPFMSDKTRYNLPFLKFSSIMNPSKTGAHIDMCFDHIFSSPKGFTARHVMDNSPTGPVLSYRWFNNGNAIATLPLNTVSVFDHFPPKHFNDKFDQFDKFYSLLFKKGYNDTKIVDISEIFHITTTIINKFKEMLEIFTVERNISMAVRFINFNKCVPFVNNQKYIDHCKQHGVPYIKDDIINVPNGADDELMTLNRFSESDEKEVPNRRVYGDSSLMTFYILQELGIYLNSNNRDEIANFINTLIKTSGTKPKDQTPPDPS